MDKYRLTTTDNPYNPFTQWDEWYFYDLSEGYNTCERLAKLAVQTDQLPYSVNNQFAEEAMDELIEVGAISKTGKFVGYKKVLNPEFNKNA